MIGTWLLALLTALMCVGVALYLLNERMTAINDRHLRAARNIGYEMIQQDRDRNLSNVELVASRPVVQEAVAKTPAANLQNDVLAPYRLTMQLDFILLVNRRLQKAGEALRTAPPNLLTVRMIRNVLVTQRPVAATLDLRGQTWLIAASPVVTGNHVVGAVIAGRVLDNGYMTGLGNRLGDYGAAIEQQGTLVSASSLLQQAIRNAKLPPPVRPAVISHGPDLEEWQIGREQFDVATRNLYDGSHAVFALVEPHVDDAMLSARFAKQAGWILFAVLLVSLLFARLVVAFALRPIAAIFPLLAIPPAAAPASPPAPPAPPPGTGRLGSATAALAEHAAVSDAKLAGQQAWMEAVLHSVPVGIAISEPGGAVTFTNAAAREYLGLNVEQPAALAAELADGTDGMRTLEGSNGRILAAVTAPVSGDGQHGGALVTVLQDVTQERQHEQLRTDFLSTISHELRTPLTAMRSSVDLLLDGDAGAMTPMQQRFLQTLRRNIERLTGLVNELLELTRIESGQVQLHVHPLDLRRLVDDVTAGLSNLFESKHQEVALDLPQEPLLVHADRRRIEQVLTNLLANASMYTPEGGRIDVAAGASNDDWVEIRVEDTGPGIEPDDQPRIFEKFFRGGRALTRQDGGTGLGLAIAKSLVELHGGRIGVRSELGHGSCFVITLPRLQGDGAP